MSEAQALRPSVVRAARSAPRLGFLGVGWIGRHRMEALARASAAQVAAVADPSPAGKDAALAVAPEAVPAASLDELLALDLDGLVIATPSAQHANQAIRALEAGLPVFCQKPLGRTAAEVRAVVDTARRADRLLGVDLSYRHTAGARRIRELVSDGRLGGVFAADLVFHNAYGPDKPWFYDAAQSGGGCVMDLGIHLVDLALWTLDFPAVVEVESVLLAGGRPLGERPGQVEDYAVATLRLMGGAVVRIACSWRLHAGRDAEIAAAFYGDAGGAELRNVGGSFYDFATHAFSGTAREALASPPDDWGGRAVVEWARRLAAAPAFDPGCERLVDVAAVLDRIYGR
jgi:predicted dehydrogenase